MLRCDLIGYICVVLSITFPQHTGSRMTQTQFITNISGTGEHYPKEMLKVTLQDYIIINTIPSPQVLYDSIKKNALPLAM